MKTQEMNKENLILVQVSEKADNRFENEKDGWMKEETIYEAQGFFTNVVGTLGDIAKTLRKNGWTSIDLILHREGKCREVRWIDLALKAPYGWVEYSDDSLKLSE